MESTVFTVKRIEGEYAYLSPKDSEDEVFIALALLPPEVDVGVSVVCENFSFSLYEA